MGYSDIKVNESSDYLKLVAGQAVTVHFLTEHPESEFVHWINREKKICSGAGCEYCSDDKPKQRWSVSVIDRSDGKEKKFEFGPMIAGQLKEIDEMQRQSSGGKKTIHDTDVRIKTTGSGLDTEYSVLPVPMSSSEDVPF